MTASSSPPTSPARIGRWSPRTSTRRWPPSSSSTASWSTIRTPSGTRSTRSSPDWDIAAYIPGEKHGTREVFETEAARRRLRQGRHQGCRRCRRQGSRQDLHRDPQGRQGGRHRRRLHRDARPHRLQQDRRRRVRPRLLREQRRQAEGRHRQGHRALDRDHRQAASIRCRVRCSST